VTRKKNTKLKTFLSHAAADLRQNLPKVGKCPCHFYTYSCFFSIGPVVSELGDSENFGGNAHRGFCLEMPNLPSESHQCQHLLFGFYQHRPRVRPCGAKKFAILAIFHVFWSRMPQIFTDFSVKFGIRESCRPWGEKPQNRTLSYCNTGGCPTRNKKLQKGKRRDCTSNITTYVNVEKNATDDMPH